MDAKRKKSIKVLSIDGGGIRGIIPAIILSEIEKQTGKKISQMFDLVVGTSTGSILSLALVKPDPKSAGEIVNLYRQEGGYIFSMKSKLAQKYGYLRLLWNLNRARYPDSNLEHILQKHFSDHQLKDSKTKTMVTAYDIANRRLHLFKSWKPEHQKVLMWQAVRASSAAPAYFSPAQVGGYGNKPVDLVDGGVSVNNPALCAYVEAKKLFLDEKILVVSLGTGKENRPYPRADLKKWGLSQWGYANVRGKWSMVSASCMVGGNIEAVEYHTEKLVAMTKGDLYYRIQTELDGAKDDMDDASAANIANLEKVAAETLKQQQRTLNEIIRNL